MNKSIYSPIASQILDFFLLSNFVFHLLKKHIYIYIHLEMATLISVIQ